MARKPTAQLVYEALLAKHETAMAQAFSDALAEITSAAELSRIVRALEAGDIEGAIRALHLDPDAYAPLLEAMRAAYLDGGAYGVEQMPARKPDGSRFVMRFDGRNDRAEAFLRESSTELVTRLISDQRAAVRVALTEGMIKGANPRATALDVIGRIDRVSGKRTGGILGLSGPQEAAASRAREELASSDPALLRNYLTRAMRDRRFDKTVQKAIAEGKAIPADTAGKALVQYRNRLLKLRGETIGRTETLTSVNAGQEEAFQQAIDKGEITANQVRDTWRSAGDDRVRESHETLNGESKGHGEAFVSPSGARMRFPGDTGLGAPASETIQCRCWLSKRIDFFANLRAAP